MHFSHTLGVSHEIRDERHDMDEVNRRGLTAPETQTYARLAGGISTGAQVPGVAGRERHCSR